MIANHSRLLIDEPALQVLPSLACAIGLNEAMLLQQVHYWLRTIEKVESRKPDGDRPHFREGRWWVYNAYDEWADQFPFWSVETIKRAIRSLETRGLIVSAQFGKAGWDRRKWYTVDYDRLNAVIVPTCPPRTGQNDPFEGGDLTPLRAGQNDPLLIRSQETTSETTAENGGASAPRPPATADEYRARVLTAMQRGLQREMNGAPDLGWLPEDVRPLADAFIAAAGVRPTRSDRTYWHKCLRQQAEAGLTPDDITGAVLAMRADQLTVADPGSVTKTARARAAAGQRPSLTPRQAAAQTDPTLRGYTRPVRH